MIQIISQKYGIEGVGISMPGGRTENQDDMGYAETPLGFLIVVCDGMGGGPGGKTASYIVKNTILETMANSTAMAAPADVFKVAVEKANEELEAKMAAMPELRGMGSTLVAVLFSDKEALVAHLGDSRCYRVKGDKMLFRTNDHSLVGELVRNGALTEEQARTSQQSNVITRGLGSSTEHVAEIDNVPYQKGDRFILCSDGVWGIMPHNDLMMRFTRKDTVSNIAKDLSEEIDCIGQSQGNSHDNHTLIIVETKKDSIIKDPMKITTKALLGVAMLALVVSVIFNIVSLLRFGPTPQLEALQLRADSLVNENRMLAMALEDKTEELETRRLSYDAALDDIIKNGANVRLQERAKMEKKVTVLESKVDSLNNVIKKMEEKLQANPAGASKNDKSSDEKAVALVDEAIRLFRLYRDASAKDEKVLKKKHAEYKKRIDEILAALSKKGGSECSKVVANIKSYMSTKKEFDSKYNVWGDKKGFVTSGQTRKFINDEIIQKLQRIKGRLNE